MTATPALTASEPAEGVATVAVNQALSVSFSKRLDVTSLNAQSVVLIGAEGSVEARVTPVERGVLLFARPARDLLPGSPVPRTSRCAKSDVENHLAVELRLG